MKTVATTSYTAQADFCVPRSPRAALLELLLSLSSADFEDDHHNHADENANRLANGLHSNGHEADSNGNCAPAEANGHANGFAPALPANSGSQRKRVNSLIGPHKPARDAKSAAPDTWTVLQDVITLNVARIRCCLPDVLTLQIMPDCL